MSFLGKSEGKKKKNKSKIACLPHWEMVRLHLPESITDCATGDGCSKPAFVSSVVLPQSRVGLSKGYKPFIRPAEQAAHRDGSQRDCCTRFSWGELKVFTPCAMTGGLAGTWCAAGPTAACCWAVGWTNIFRECALPCCPKTLLSQEAILRGKIKCVSHATIALAPFVHFTSFSVPSSRYFHFCFVAGFYALHGMLHENFTFGSYS